MLTLDPIWHADIQQLQFRLLLNAMAYPGRCYRLSDSTSKSPAYLSVLATLLDSEVSLSDPHGLLHEQDWPLLQANEFTPDEADYILCDASKKPDFTPKSGTLNSPEQSATLILRVDQLSQGDACLKLTGPGIVGVNVLPIKGLTSEWLTMRAQWNCAFPLGVDWILVDSTTVAALPRTIAVELE